MFSKINLKIMLSNSKNKIIIYKILTLFIVYFSPFVLSKVYDVKPLYLVRDLHQICASSILVGFISNIGILFWCTTASICLFTAFSNLCLNKFKYFLITGGLLTTILLLDDFFLIHDRYVKEEIMYVFYFVSLIIICFKFRNILLKIDSKLLILSTVFFLLSLFFDITLQKLIFNYEFSQIGEELFKFLGIGFWANFWITSSLNQLKFNFSKKR